MRRIIQTTNIVDAMVVSKLIAALETHKPPNKRARVSWLHAIISLIILGAESSGINKKVTKYWIGWMMNAPIAGNIDGRKARRAIPTL